MGDQQPAGPDHDRSDDPVFRSALFQAPGRPRPLARRLAIHNRVVRRIRQFLEEEQFNETPVPPVGPVTASAEETPTVFVLDHCGELAFASQSGQFQLDAMLARGFPAVWCESESLRREWQTDERHLTSFKLVEAERQNLTLGQLCDLMEKLLKTVAADLGADLLGGRHVTRLDRMLNLDHPRMTYREALAALNSRGWSIPFGGDLHRDAEATLIRYCGNQPCLVTHWPTEMKLFNVQTDPADAAVTLSVEYILPFAGETMDGAVHESDPEILEQRLQACRLFRQLGEQARDFARARVAIRSSNKNQPPATELAAHFQVGILKAFAHYVGLFAGKPTQRAGFGLGVGRLLQYLMGLQSIQDAVICPVDRKSLHSLHKRAAVA
jgi:aspartyl/asparaginyl-tRNA synthetase